MKNQAGNEITPFYSRLTKVAAVTSIIIGCSTLFGWALDIALLKKFLFGGVAMKANTAVGFVLVGFSLLIGWGAQAPREGKTARQLLSKALAFFVVILSTLTLFEYALGWNLGIDELLFRDLADSTFPGRMVLPTAVSFLLMGCALLLLRERAAWAVWSAQAASLIVPLVSTFCFLGLTLSLIDANASMAAHTALGFIVLSGGLLAARPSEGLMRTISSEGLGGQTARRLLPIACALPPLLAWLRWEGEQMGYYGTLLGISIMAVSLVMVLGVFIYLNAIWLERIDVARQRAELELRESEGRFQLLMRATNDAVYDWDIDTGGLWFNQNLEKCFGYAAQTIDVSLEWWTTRIHPEDEAAISQSLSSFLESEAKVWVGEYRFLRGDGTYAHVLNRGIAVRNDAGKVVRMTGSMMDITERKMAEDALREVKLLQGILPLCSYCKKIRDDKNYWQQVEHYIADHSEAEFSHGICPDCYEGYVRPQIRAARQNASLVS